MKVRASLSELTVGNSLPWDLYNADGRCLFRKGFVINTESSLQRMLSMELYHDPASSCPPDVLIQGKPIPPSRSGLPSETRLPQSTIPDTAGTGTKPPEPGGITMRQALARCVSRQQQISVAIQQGKTDQRPLILQLIDDIERVYRSSADASLAAVHHAYQHPLSDLQPVYTAILAIVMADALKMDPHHRQCLVGAALTANLGMYQYFDVLVNCSSPLTDEERAFLHTHPESSKCMLQQNGINDDIWLTAVIQHHERGDGTGYPARLQRKEISVEAAILATIDTYLAMIMPRTYRKALSPSLTMQKLYQAAVSNDDVIAIGLIKTLGVYPPGSLVRLASQEIAIVTERNLLHSIAPNVMALGKIGGHYYAEPVLRQTDTQIYAIVDAFEPAIPVSIDTNAIWDKRIMINFEQPDRYHP